MYSLVEFRSGKNFITTSRNVINKSQKTCLVEYNSSWYEAKLILKCDDLRYVREYKCKYKYFHLLNKFSSSTSSPMQLVPLLNRNEIDNYFDKNNAPKLPISSSTRPTIRALPAVKLTTNGPNCSHSTPHLSSLQLVPDKTSKKKSETNLKPSVSKTNTATGISTAEMSLCTNGKQRVQSNVIPTLHKPHSLHQNSILSSATPTYNTSPANISLQPTSSANISSVETTDACDGKAAIINLKIRTDLFENSSLSLIPSDEEEIYKLIAETFLSVTDSSSSNNSESSFRANVSSKHGNTADLNSHLKSTSATRPGVTNLKNVETSKTKLRIRTDLFDNILSPAISSDDDNNCDSDSESSFSLTSISFSSSSESSTTKERRYSKFNLTAATAPNISNLKHVETAKNCLKVQTGTNSSTVISSNKKESCIAKNICNTTKSIASTSTNNNFPKRFAQSTIDLIDGNLNPARKASKEQDNCVEANNRVKTSKNRQTKQTGLSKSIASSEISSDEEVNRNLVSKSSISLSSNSSCTYSASLPATNVSRANLRRKRPYFNLTSTASTTPNVSGCKYVKTTKNSLKVPTGLLKSISSTVISSNQHDNCNSISDSCITKHTRNVKKSAASISTNKNTLSQKFADSTIDLTSENLNPAKKAMEKGISGEAIKHVYATKSRLKQPTGLLKDSSDKDGNCNSVSDSCIAKNTRNVKRSTALTSTNNENPPKKFAQSTIDLTDGNHNPTQKASKEQDDSVEAIKRVKTAKSRLKKTTDVLKSCALSIVSSDKEDNCKLVSESSFSLSSNSSSSSSTSTTANVSRATLSRKRVSSNLNLTVATTPNVSSLEHVKTTTGLCKSISSTAISSNELDNCNSLSESCTAKNIRNTTKSTASTSTNNNALPKKCSQSTIEIANENINPLKNASKEQDNSVEQIEHVEAVKGKLRKTTGLLNDNSDKEDNCNSISESCTVKNIRNTTKSTASTSTNNNALPKKCSQSTIEIANKNLNPLKNASKEQDNSVEAVKSRLRKTTGLLKRFASSDISSDDEGNCSSTSASSFSLSSNNSSSSTSTADDVSRANISRKRLKHVKTTEKSLKIPSVSLKSISSPAISSAEQENCNTISETRIEKNARNTTETTATISHNDNTTIRRKSGENLNSLKKSHKEEDNSVKAIERPLNLSGVEVPHRGQIKTKKHFCLFCKTLQSKISRHLFAKHGAEQQIKEAKRLPTKSKQRLKIIEELRKEGDFIHNTSQELNSGILIVSRQQQQTRHNNVDNYVCCINCKGFFSKHSLRVHLARCGNRAKNSRSNLINGRKLTQYIHSAANFSLKTEIFPVLRDDAITKAIRYDELIIQFGNTMSERYTFAHNHDTIRSQLRLLGRFLIEIRNLESNINQLRDIFKPSYFDSCVKAIRKIANWDEKVLRFNNPVVAQSLTTIIKKCATKQRCEYIKSQSENEQKQLQDFLFLWDEEIPDLINKRTRRCN